MMKIAFTMTKGGVGKTTICLLVARALAEAGVDVAIWDHDRQKTATEWWKKSPEPDKYKIVESAAEAAEMNCALLLIDTPQSDDGVKLAAKEADVCILPTSPSPADLWSLKAASDILANSTSAPVRVVFNKVKPRTDIHEARGVSIKQIGCVALKNFLPDSVQFQNVIVNGWSGLRADSKRVIERLAAEIMSVGMSGSGGGRKKGKGR